MAHDPGLEIGHKKFGRRLTIQVAPVIAPLAGSLFFGDFHRQLAGDLCWACACRRYVDSSNLVYLKSPETLKVADRNALIPHYLVRNYTRFLTTRACLSYAVVGALSFASTRCW
jgi:hypothetical protein